MGILNKINEIKTRKEIPKYDKFETKNSNSNVVNTEKKKLYKYYKCDYCNDEIRLDKKQHERSGGIVSIPHSITKCGKLELVLCNKCLKDVIKEFKE